MKINRHFNDLIKFSIENSHPENCRKLGILFSVLFFSFHLWMTLKNGKPLSTPGLLGPLMIILLSLAAPLALKPITMIWFGLSWVLHFITNPIIMLIVFYGVITPIGFLKRLFGSQSKPQKSYWIKRTPPGPQPKDIQNQF